MNDPLRELFQSDTLQPDALMTQRVVERYMAHRAKARKWRRVLATIGPLSAAAVVAIAGLLVHQNVQRTRQRQASQAVAMLIRDTRFEQLVRPSLIDEALEQTSLLLDPDQTLALLIPQPRELIQPTVPATDQGTQTP